MLNWYYELYILLVLSSIQKIWWMESALTLQYPCSCLKPCFLKGRYFDSQGDLCVLLGQFGNKLIDWWVDCNMFWSVQTTSSERSFVTFFPRDMFMVLVWIECCDSIVTPSRVSVISCLSLIDNWACKLLVLVDEYFGSNDHIPLFISLDWALGPVIIC